MVPPEKTPPVAIVTGGSRGIGRAIVRRLAERGFVVRFTFLQQEQAAVDLAAELERDGHHARGVRVDARDAAASGEMVDSVISELGRLDVLVNNAGVTADRLLALMEESQWSSVLATSMSGLFGATKRAVREMMRRRRGRIINVTSVSGLMGMPGQTNYSAAKAAIVGFTRSLALEVATAGIPVNAVAPGYIDTDMLSAFSEDQREAAERRVPMGRFGTADEAASVVSFLACDAPEYLTGHVLVIDGGLST
jgi:3-oxoacyl-[acyl-carrier protein] reductase